MSSLGKANTTRQRISLNKNGISNGVNCKVPVDNTYLWQCLMAFKCSVNDLWKPRNPVSLKN